MSMSGVKISNDCINEYLDVKKNKKKWMIYKLNDKKDQIIPDTETSVAYNRDVQNPEDFEKFNSLLPELQCRYAVYHAVMTLDDNQTESERDRIIFISWAPDNAKIKDKMLHSSSKDALKQALEGLGIEFQLSCEQEKEAAEWISRFNDLPNLKMAGQICKFEGRAAGDW